MSKGFGDVDRLFHTVKYSDTQEQKKVIGEFQLSSKKSFESGVIIPSKKRNCEKCDDILCEDCDLKTRQGKEFDANLKQLNRKSPNLLRRILLGMLEFVIRMW